MLRFKLQKDSRSCPPHPVCSLTRCFQKKHPPHAKSKQASAGQHSRVFCHLPAHWADLQQEQHSASCRRWVRGPCSPKTELGDGKTELGALPPSWPGSDHSGPGLLRPNLLREGPGGQGWPSGTSNLAPQISSAQYLHQWVGHSQPPRFPLLPLFTGLRI